MNSDFFSKIDEIVLFCLFHNIVKIDEIVLCEIVLFDCSSILLTFVLIFIAFWKYWSGWKPRWMDGFGNKNSDGCIWIWCESFSPSSVQGDALVFSRTKVQIAKNIERNNLSTKSLRWARPRE